MSDAPGTASPLTPASSAAEALSRPDPVVEFAIAGMTCAACSARLEKVLNRQPGIQANVNLAAERARARLDGAIEDAGFDAE